MKRTGLKFILVHSAVTSVSCLASWYTTRLYVGILSQYVCLNKLVLYCIVRCVDDDNLSCVARFGGSVLLDW